MSPELELIKAIVAREDKRAEAIEQSYKDPDAPVDWPYFVRKRQAEEKEKDEKALLWAIAAYILGKEGLGPQKEA